MNPEQEKQKPQQGALKINDRVYGHVTLNKPDPV